MIHTLRGRRRSRNQRSAGRHHGRLGVAAIALLSVTLAAPPLAAAPSARVVHPAPQAAEGWTIDPLQLDGSYLPVVGFFGIARSTGQEIIWYAPGLRTDYLWVPTSRGHFRSIPLRINGDYIPIVGRFFENDTSAVGDDIIWYAPGATADPVWIPTGTASLFDKSHHLDIEGAYIPTVIPNEAVGPGEEAHEYRDAILWQAKGAGPSEFWVFSPTSRFGHTSYAASIPAGTKVVAGDFSDHLATDLFLYGPGSIPDSLWQDAQGPPGRDFLVSARPVSGSTYQPVYALGTDGDGQRHDGIFWWNSGAGPEQYWRREATILGATRPRSTSAVGTAISSGRENITYIYVPNGPDLEFVGSATGGTYRPLDAVSDHGPGYHPIVGDFDGHPDLLWYGPGTRPDAIWYPTNP